MLTSEISFLSHGNVRTKLEKRQGQQKNDRLRHFRAEIKRAFTAAKGIASESACFTS